MKLVNVSAYAPIRTTSRSGVRSRSRSSDGKRRAVVIGGGIHGVAVAVALAREKLSVTLIERNSELLAGTSAATHNRAHLGFHYPRSLETAIECLRGVEDFKRKYPQALYYPEAAYYLIEQDSKTTASDYEKFCQHLNLPYALEWPKSDLLLRDRLTASFRVSEPCYKLAVLKQALIDECRQNGVRILLNCEFVEARCNRDLHHLTVVQDGATRELSSDLVINATYAYTNSVLREAGLERDMNEYEFQTTEVVVVRSPRRALPALTVMDGPFITLMPLAGSDDLMLVYDVVHSAHESVRGKIYERPTRLTTHWPKMIEHGAPYFPFLGSLQYVRSLWGARPIPIDDTRGSRETRVIAHKAAPGFFSIQEGKFTSAPLVADRFVAELREQCYLE